MKRAIVFAGGGTKGAYQAGVVKAINELNIDYDIVTGTSIGALNGCLLAQKDYEAMYELWEHLDLDDIMEDGIDLKFTFENMKNQADLIMPFLKSYFNHKGANVAPLKEMIDTLANENRMEESNVDFGLVTVEYPNLKPHELVFDQMKGHLKEYLLASASCFPAFPICELDGKHYIDGGYFDNLPIDLAFKMGADEIIAVEITYERFTHPHYENRPNIKIIRPTLYNGQFLDFDKAMIDRRMKLGYNDAMKKLGDYLGNMYTFYPVNDDRLAKHLYQEILKYEGNLNRNFVKRNSKIINNLPLSSFVFELFSHPTYQDYLITALEKTSEFYDIDPLEIYSIEDITNQLKDLFQKDLDSFNERIVDELKNLDGINIKEMLESLSKHDLVCYLYTIMTNDYDKFKENWIYPFFNNEMLIAFLFYCL